MANTVTAAFREFMRDAVNLDSGKTTQARASRDWLLQQIEGFNDFFPLFRNNHIYLGSFARRTKKRPLDDIDIMICLSGEGITWTESYDTVFLTVPDTANSYHAYKHDLTAHLNSRKVINRFVSKLKSVQHYSQADIKLNHEAATLKLTSYEWNFDIVPCFLTEQDTFGRSYYVIPDGKGNWKRTDPRKDRDRVSSVNKDNKGDVLAAIRIMKYWNKRPTMPTMGSYLLENLILDYYEHPDVSCQDDTSDEVIKLLRWIGERVYYYVGDPKLIQGDLNDLSDDEKQKISSKAYADAKTAAEAALDEYLGDQEGSIDKWRTIFGDAFPTYG